MSVQQIAVVAMMAAVLACSVGKVPQGRPQERWPGKEWPTASPVDVGLDAAALAAFSAFVGGRGCVIRHGSLVYSWGNASARGDVASAVKPIYNHLLHHAVSSGLLPSLDQKVVEWEPRLKALNPTLGYKDRNITWRHMANQISGYEVANDPGTAFDYNDWQMALFIDTLVQKVYQVNNYSQWDSRVLNPLLCDVIQCEDAPTLMAFGTQDRPGRLAISPRDFARFGMLYMRNGTWNGSEVLPAQVVRDILTEPVPNSILQSSAAAAQVIPGQRSLGSTRVPDSQTDHLGSYSWLWWINGVNRTGGRHWPAAPVDSFAACGHGGQEDMFVFPSLDMIVSWNECMIVTTPDIEAHAVSLAMAAVIH